MCHAAMATQSLPLRPTALLEAARLEQAQVDGDAASNQVHVTAAGSGQAAPTLGGGVLLHNANLLQRLEDVAHQAACSMTMRMHAA